MTARFTLIEGGGEILGTGTPEELGGQDTPTGEAPSANPFDSGPSIGVAAFLTNTLLARLIAIERSEIGLLKAFGYSDWSIGWHYAKLVIAKLAGILLIMQDLNLRAEGHTDATGPYDYNLRLSDMRADRVMQHLITFGVDSSRLDAQGFGETRPVASNRRSRGRAKNRRVDFKPTMR